MEILKKIFDDFNIHARIIPALITVLPIYIYLLLKNWLGNSFIQNLLANSLICVILIAPFYRFVRNLGKKYEEKMYKDLGGMPTTILLRYSNNEIDAVTTTRYHNKLNQKVNDVKLPIKKEEETSDDDIEYESAVTWLRKYANDNREKEFRVYQELKDYNFWRNLYGGKIIIVLICIGLILLECYQLAKFNIIELMNNPFPRMNVLFVILGIMIASCIIINKKTVKNKAFDYAKTLLEVCESL